MRFPLARVITLSFFLSFWVFMVSSPAAAVVYTITYSGVITNDPLSSQGEDLNGYAGADFPLYTGIDLIGLFGPTGANLAGDTIVTTYTIDTGVAGIPNLIYEYSPDMAAIEGGSEFVDDEFPTPFTSLTVVVGSSSLDLTDGFGTDERAVAYTGVNSAFSGALSDTQFVQFEHSSDPSRTGEAFDARDTVLTSSPMFTGALSLARSFSYNTVPTDNTTESLYVGGGAFALGFGEYINADITNVTVAGTAVPEPSSWWMMFIGVGILGGVFRRRRSSQSEHTARFLEA